MDIQSDQKPRQYIADREIQGVAFNFEGTCIDVEAVHFSAHLKLLEVATGISIELREENWPTIIQLMPNFIGGPREQVVEDIYRLQFVYKRDVILPREELRNQDELFYKLYLDKVNITTRPGLREWVRYLCDVCRLPVAMGTTTGRKEAEYIIGKSKLNTVFAPSQIVYGKTRDIENRPKPDIYLATAEKMGIDPKFQLVIGDSFTSDAPAAAAAGSVFVATPLIDTIKFRKRFYAEGAIAVFPDWSEVTLFGYQQYLRRTNPANQQYVSSTQSVLPAADDIFSKTS
jgi:beta-phosphoglucomutase-like phosphatase (HAD superfamily)